MINTILVALDGSDHASKALRLASDLGAKYGSHVILVHILLHNARSETLRRLAEQQELPQEIRNQIETYEADFQKEMLSYGGSAEAIGFVPAPVPENLVLSIGQHIMERAERIAKEAGVQEITPYTLNGEPADTILELATKHKADMIILGSRGLGHFEGLWLGSVSHKVSVQANCTCVTVK